jgi:hypothetical protein
VRSARAANALADKSAFTASGKPERCHRDRAGSFTVDSHESDVYFDGTAAVNHPGH